MGGNKSGADPVDNTSRRDVPFWLQPQAYGLLDEWFQFYSPGTQYWTDEDGQYHYNAGENRQYQGPDLPDYNFSGTTGEAIGRGVEQAKGGNPYSPMAQSFVGDQLGGNTDLANQVAAYTMGGPIAGASRSGTLEELMGTSQAYGRQSQLDAMYGNTANRAEDNLFNMLQGDRALSRQGAYQTQYGPGAQAARQGSNRTVQGMELAADPTASGAMLNNNPYIDAQFNRAASVMGDQYRDHTAPAAAAQFAHAGSFGGSAHQNLQAEQRYGYGRNVEDLAANMYGAQYQAERGMMEQARDRERQIQEGAINRERQFSEGMLSQELGRQFQGTTDAMNRRQETGLAERAGYRGLLNQQQQNQQNFANSTMNRGAQMLPYLPQLRAADYIDINALMQLGDKQDQRTFQNDMSGYQNQLNSWEYDENIMRFLAQGLAPMIQSTGYTQAERAGKTLQSPPSRSPQSQAGGQQQSSGKGGAGGTGFNFPQWILPQGGEGWTGKGAS